MCHFLTLIFLCSTTWRMGRGNRLSSLKDLSYSYFSCPPFSSTPGQEAKCYSKTILALNSVFCFEPAEALLPESGVRRLVGKPSR